MRAWGKVVLDEMVEMDRDVGWWWLKSYNIQGLADKKVGFLRNHLEILSEEEI